MADTTTRVYKEMMDKISDYRMMQYGYNALTADKKGINSGFRDVNQKFAANVESLILQCELAITAN